MSEGHVAVVVLPVLVPLGPVARVEDDVGAGIVEAGLVPPDLALLGQHPVLVAALVVARPESHSLRVKYDNAV